jgi:DNA-binding CsgD family transcriptional regulator
MVERVQACARASSNVPSFSAAEQRGFFFDDLFAVWGPMSSAVVEPQRLGSTVAQHVATLIATSSQAMLLFDDDRRLLAANAPACRLLGRSMNTLTQMRVGDLCPPGTANGEVEDLDRWWRRFLDRGSESGTCTMSAADGGVVVAHYYARANFAQGLHLSLFVPGENGRGPVSGTLDGNHEHPPELKRGTLTQRERDVLALVAAGLTGVEIASRLSISPPTVESHVGNAMRKLGATNRAHATALALQAGLISL